MSSDGFLIAQQTEREQTEELINAAELALDLNRTKDALIISENTLKNLNADIDEIDRLINIQSITFEFHKRMADTNSSESQNIIEKDTAIVAKSAELNAKYQEFSKKSRELDEFPMKIARLEAALAERKTEKLALINEPALHYQKQQVASSEIGELDEALATLKEQEGELEVAGRNLSEETGRLRNEILPGVNENARLINENQLLNEQISKCNFNIQSVRNEIYNLSSKEAALKQQEQMVDALAAKLHEQQNLENEQNDKVISLEVQRDKLNDNIAGKASLVWQLLTDMAIQVADLNQTTLVESNENCEKLRQLLREESAQVKANFTLATTNLNKEISTRNEKLQELNTRYSLRDTEIKTIESEISANNSRAAQLNQLQIAINEKQTQLDSLTAIKEQEEKLLEEIANVKNEEQKMKIKDEELQKAIDKKLNRIAKLNKNINQLRETKERLLAAYKKKQQRQEATAKVQPLQPKSPKKVTFQQHVVVRGGTDTEDSQSQSVMDGPSTALERKLSKRDFPAQ